MGCAGRVAQSGAFPVHEARGWGQAVGFWLDEGSEVDGRRCDPSGAAEDDGWLAVLAMVGVGWEHRECSDGGSGD